MKSGNATGLDRRGFLRGLGVGIALPAFGSLWPIPARAATESVAEGVATTATGAPLRTAFVFFPNGAVPSRWWPEGTETDFRLGETLRPLEGLRSQLQVLGGLDHACANPGPDGAGDHARATGVFLTGVRLNKSATDIRAGTSIDQVIARSAGNSTRLSSLELTCDTVRQAGTCDFDYSCTYQYNLSWSTPTTPATPEANPRRVFERLFGAGEPGERTLNRLRRQQEDRSVLDYVLDETRRMQRRLGREDQDKLDQYLTSVRSVEARLQRSERLGPPRDPDRRTPAGIPAGHTEHVQLMYDLLVLAFQTDSTRVASFCLAHDGDNRPFPEIGVAQGHHDLSHHSNRPEKIAKLLEIERWYVTQFGRFLQSLQEIQDMDGRSLLHNSMIVYGGGNADANQHTHTNLPILLAGGGGGSLRPGRRVHRGSQPATNLFLSLADRMGVRGLERFGDSTGRLDGL